MHQVTTPKGILLWKHNSTHNSKSYWMCYLEKYHSTKSYQIYYLKAITAGLSVATMYYAVHNFVRLPWQPFKSHSLISWGLLVTTTRRNIKLLVHNLKWTSDYIFFRRRPTRSRDIWTACGNSLMKTWSSIRRHSTETRYGTLQTYILHLQRVKGGTRKYQVITNVPAVICVCW